MEKFFHTLEIALGHHSHCGSAIGDISLIATELDAA